MIEEIAKKRSTIRNFHERDVDFEDILKILEVARQAPSGMNTQPWRFIIVKDKGVKKKIREACEEAEMRFHPKVAKWMRDWLSERGITPVKPYLTEAPYLIVVCVDETEPYSKESVWLAVGYMLLMTKELGLGTVTYHPSSTAKVREILDIPGSYAIETILPVGHPAGEKKKEERRNLEDLAYKDRWGTSLS